MDINKTREQLIQDFNLSGISTDDQETFLLEIAKTIQKQFLLDVYEQVGEKQFEALQASVSMGEEFYSTTLKHLVPNYEDLFQKSRQKVVSAFQKEN